MFSRGIGVDLHFCSNKHAVVDDGSSALLCVRIERSTMFVAWPLAFDFRSFRGGNEKRRENERR